ncbi:MAG: helix-turn-helix transcriptional regulator [Anaerolineae bacterium]|nr:MAG: helix-turn-helix transcriptional regulator [Anaerolineae bacterium]WKZ44339.1 MAG: LuxR C-terminal-related transcriptional regulator [Anaerolineales bacterium]
MAIPILATKLYIPPPPPKLVARSRLVKQLTDGLSSGHKLTIVSAPAGFGKSTLVSEWVVNCGRQVAWLSLDENDNDPTRFLIYVICSLQTISPNLGANILDTLQSPQIPPIDSILTALLNEISDIPDAFILVLDDYHLTDAKSVDDALAFLIEHLPPQMHLVITTREDPSLPIHRLRARNQLTEIRAADLRFTSSEAAEFLNQVMGLRLASEDVAALEARTEGWIAGLQLAALSIGGRNDIHGFIQSFAGDHRYIMDYLVEEVLRRQSETTRNFLLQTSILDRLNGSICDAVTAQPGGKSRLEQLQRGNLFLIPLDDKRDWYRYHHLFADVLRMHLMAEQPDLVSMLHHRASEWYELNELTADAIHHALVGEDFERAAGLIEKALPIMRQSRQEPTLLRWLKALPNELFQPRPVLNVHYIGILMQNGQFDGVESRLQDVEQWLTAPEDIREQPVYVDEEEFQRIPSSVAMYQAAIALAQGDVVNAMKNARKVLELARKDEDFPRGAASSLLGLASWTSGDLKTAYEMFSKGMAHLHKVGYVSDVIGGSVTLADIRITQGRLREAMIIYERGLQLATKQGAPVLRGAADMYVGMAELYREHNDLNAAMQSLQKSKELGEFNGLPKNPYRWRVAMARIKEAQGDFDDAFQLLNEAEPRFMADFSPNVRPVTALKARVWIKQGKLEKALDWARERKLSIEEEPSYLREFEQITFARILLSQGDDTDSLLNDATGYLERLLKAAEAGGRNGSVIEILILQTLAHQMREDIPAALSALERALALAEPEGYIRLFVDEGTAMEALLRKVATNKIMPDYAGRLLSAFEAERIRSGEETPPYAAPVSGFLIEPLSQRELDILRLFKTELSGPEIAQELVIALSTVRSHTKSIYNKLNVNSRRGAVKRAIELGLI